MVTGGEAKRRVSPLAVLGWVGLAILLVVAALAALGALNRTVYSASAFVTEYLDALADDDAGVALSLPGVEMSAAELEAAGLPADISTAMLRPGVMTEGPTDIQIVETIEEEDGTRTVMASYRLGETIAESTFSVRPLAPLYGALARWEFASSPLEVLDVTVQHGALFSVGSLTLDTRANKSGDELAAFTQTAPYLVFAPATYEMEYQSKLLRAAPVEVAVTGAERLPVTLDLQPTDAFVEQVQVEINRYLDEECATQQVLQPSGCPFGIVIEDRVTSPPVWTIVEYPAVTLVAGDSGFEMPETPGVAHISVEVQSLFDGEYFQLEEDRPINLALTATIKPDGSIAIQLR
jgi:hypothetical protein